MTVTPVDPATLDWSSQTGPGAVVRRVVAAAQEADGRAPLDEAATLALAGGDVSGSRLFVAGAEGFAFLRGAEADLVVAPAARGRGLGGALGRAVLDAAGDAPLTVWSHGDHPAAARLAERLGLRPVRALWVMRRPLTTVPDAPVPEGFALRAFRPGADDAAFLAVNAEAFAWHPEQGRLDQRGLDERKALDWFDPAGFLLAERDGRLAGFHWTKVHGGGVGEVYVIAVAPSAQGTGLARALLAAGLAHLRDRGLAEVVLYVEADNTRAVRLYEREGFTHAAEDTHVMYARSRHLSTFPAG